MSPADPPPDIDARVRFYLEHREHIETWHRLRSDAVRWSREILEEVVPLLGVLAESHDLELRDAQTGKWRILSLAPATTLLAPDGTPLASVALSWSDDVVPDDTELAPCVGVRVSMADDRGPALRDVLGNETRTERKARGARKDRWWPIWQRVLAPVGWWDDPADYLRQLTESVDDYTRSLGDIVTTEMSARTSG